jgi:hypothetical protein
VLVRVAHACRPVIECRRRHGVWIGRCARRLLSRDRSFHWWEWFFTESPGVADDLLRLGTVVALFRCCGAFAARLVLVNCAAQADACADEVRLRTDWYSFRRTAVDDVLYESVVLLGGCGWWLVFLRTREIKFPDLNVCRLPRPLLAMVRSATTSASFVTCGHAGSCYGRLA